MQIHNIVFLACIISQASMHDSNSADKKNFIWEMERQGHQIFTEASQLIVDESKEIVSGVKEFGDFFRGEAVDAVTSALELLDHHCACSGAPPFQTCGCCITIASNGILAEPFCVEMNLAGASLLSTLTQGGVNVATWKLVIAELAENIRVCVQILPIPSVEVISKGCSVSGLGTVAVCVTPEIVHRGSDGSPGYYELCVSLNLGFLGIFEYDLELGCFGLGEESRNWACVYPSSANPDRLPMCDDVCKAGSENWLESWTSQSEQRDKMMFSKRCGAVLTEEGLCTKGCFPKIKAVKGPNSEK